MSFLESVWPTDPHLWGELRIISPSGAVTSEWITLGPDRDLEARYHSFDYLDSNIYYGVLPRTQRRGTNADCVTTTTVLWADVDGKHYSPTDALAGKPQALGAIHGLDVPPSILVDSGRGYHAYWLLRSPVAVEEASRVMKAIADEVGGDHVQDAARVLRLPGTLNHKTDPPAHCRTIYLSIGARYDLGDFLSYLPAEHPLLHRAPKSDPADWDELPLWLRDLITDGVPEGTRSEAAFKVCAWLSRYGWSDDAIEGLFENHPSGIGSKYADKGKDARRWMRTTMMAAHRAEGAA